MFYEFSALTLLSLHQVIDKSMRAFIKVVSKFDGHIIRLGLHFANKLKETADD